MSVTENYCSFKVAKLLKEKGFNEVCRYEYGVPDVDKGYVLQEFYKPIQNSELIDTAYTAPTHQMALKWLREVHKININILYDLQRFVKTNGTTENVDVYEVDVITEKGTFYIGNYNHYESACETAIKYCLTNLI